MRLLSLIAVLPALTACAAWNEDFTTMQRPDTTTVPYEVRTSQAAAAVREMEPKRKVADQDCSKPFDPAAGNVRCR